MMYLQGLPAQVQQRMGFTSTQRGNSSHDVNTNMQGELRKKIQNYSFLLCDKIGKGYSSTVYKGTDDLTGEQVAIKVIQLRTLRDQTSRAMLQTQIQCFKEVQHQNVLRYINSFYTANNCYIITQNCPCSDLAKVMKQKGRIAEKEAAVLFVQMFQGYKAFNQAGYIHRDIKPANIFIGKDQKLRLADFGFSKKRTLIDRENYNVGTPIYMPRESLAANIYNEKTDTWALGVTLYEMVYGQVPFRGRTQPELRVNIERGTICFPDFVTVSTQFKDFIKLSLLNDSLKRMGIKQMENHPWLVKYLSKPSLWSESPDKVGQQHEIRSSLPNDIVVQNRSSDYFQSKQNRRSVSTMQKLKLCMPKKSSQILKPRQALGDRTIAVNNKQNDSSQNKQNKSHNRSISSARQTVKSSIQKKQNPSKGIQKVVSLINYFRLLYRILEKVRQISGDVSNSSVKIVLQKAEKALMDRVSEIFKKHLLSVSEKSNQFSLNASQWIHFATSERWQMYEFVINRYKSKYSEIIHHSHLGQWQTANKLFINTGEILQGYLDKLLLKQRYGCIEIIGLMSHLCTLDKVIQTQGWQSFSVIYNTNNSILHQPYTINMDNYLQIECELTRTLSEMKDNNF